ncbi:MAG: carbohydrate-binding family 9-like protein, partial [Planctomycetota bacterium]|nr:carbohydrate-binding family 9-like protein [Planctomycetota bacterium]
MKNRVACIFVFLMTLCVTNASRVMLQADEPTLAEIRHPKGVGFPPVADQQLAKFVARRTSHPLAIDGKLGEESWRQVEASNAFVDLVSGKPTLYETTIKVLWDDQYLYVGYEVEEPNVKAKFLNRDDLIWQDND